MTDLCVIGLGYVGLPTAALFARAGVDVLGVDVNPAIVRSVNAGAAPFEEPGLSSLLKEVVAEERLRAATSPSEASAFIVAVGTPIDEARAPDLRSLRAAVEAVGRVLRRGDLVVIESTVPPGTTRGLVASVLRDVSGLEAGRDFHLAHCAERAIPGKALLEMVQNDRLVGGIDRESARRAAALYAKMVKGTLIEETELASEIVKLAENTYRDVNIAFANELAGICERVGADVWRVIEHANRHPRVSIHAPGPGVGGHCIPVVPWFLAAVEPGETPLIERARYVNDAQVERLVERVTGACQAAAAAGVVAVLGVAYKAATTDARNTPALPLVRGLAGAGIHVRATDPHVREFPEPLVGLEDALRGADVIVVMNDEPEYRALEPSAVARLVRSRIVFDTRNVLSRERWAEMGFRVVTLGVGNSGSAPPGERGASIVPRGPPADNAVVAPVERRK